MAIVLTKGQRILLEKDTGGGLTRIVMGLGWDPIKKKGWFGFGGGTVDVDLDASCLMFDGLKNVVDVVFFNHLTSEDGSIVHTGDNRTGAGDGDDEQIKVDLSQVPAEVKSLVFVVNSFLGHNFSQIENATCRLVDGGNGREVARYDLSCQGPHTAQIMTKVYRHNNEWKLHAIGESCNGRTFNDLIPNILPHL